MGNKRRIIPLVILVIFTVVICLIKPIQSQKANAELGVMKWGNQICVDSCYNEDETNKVFIRDSLLCIWVSEIRVPTYEERMLYKEGKDLTSDALVGWTKTTNFTINFKTTDSFSYTKGRTVSVDLGIGAPKNPFFDLGVDFGISETESSVNTHSETVEYSLLPLVDHWYKICLTSQESETTCREIRRDKVYSVRGLHNTDDGAWKNRVYSQEVLEYDNLTYSCKIKETNGFWQWVLPIGMSPNDVTDYDAELYS